VITTAWPFVVVAVLLPAIFEIVGVRATPAAPHLGALVTASSTSVIASSFPATTSTATSSSLLRVQGFRDSIWLFGQCFVLFAFLQVVHDLRDCNIRLRLQHLDVDLEHLGEGCKDVVSQDHVWDSFGSASDLVGDIEEL